MKVKFTLLQACDCLLIQTGVKCEFQGIYLVGLFNQYPQTSSIFLQERKDIVDLNQVCL